MLTFREQAEVWLNNLQTRKRDPIKPVTAIQFRSHLNTLLPLIGDTPLASVNNRALKELVPKLRGSPKTVQCFLTTTKAVVGSLLDEDGQPIYKTKWNSSFIDSPDVCHQDQPSFDSQQVADIVCRGNGSALLYKLAGGTGLRIGEILALDVPDLKGRTLTITKNLSQKGEIGTPKTEAGNRLVDLSPNLADELSEHLRGRTGFMFETRTQSTASLHLNQILTCLGIKEPRMGFHSFRRFRITHLGKNKVTNELIRFWVGHSKPDITARYDKIDQDEKYRLAEAERVGLGF